MSRSRRGASRWRTAGRLRRGLAAIALAAMLGVTAGGSSGPGPAPLPARVRDWQQDIAYLAGELPAVRAAGLGPVPRSAWDAAAARLQAAVPRLTDGQIVVGMAKLVAMLHDDETLIQFPPGPFVTLDAQWVGADVYLLAVPPADRAMLGAQLLEVDGRPVTEVLVAIGTTVGAEDPQLQRNTETGLLDDLDLLHSLGLTASATSVVLTVRTTAGTRETVRVAADPHSSGSIYAPGFFVDQFPGLAHVPLPLYRQDATRPYWMRVLPAQHAVYLRYHQCRPDLGFAQLVAQAVALLGAHPDYRLIVDLRDNPGGMSGGFGSLIGGLAVDPALKTRGRVIGLVNQFTDSSATVDAQSLKQAGAVLIGQPPADPIDEWGGWQTFRLPHSRALVQYTTTVVNGSGTLWGMPDRVVEPTLAQILNGDDPVLTAALSYRV